MLTLHSLPNKLPNNLLSAMVLEEFTKFGACSVCAFRGKDKRGARRPYAIVQFAVSTSLPPSSYYPNVLISSRAVKMRKPRTIAVRRRTWEDVLCVSSCPIAAMRSKMMDLTMCLFRSGLWI